MPTIQLPEVCCRCRKLKTVDKGRFFTSRDCYRRRFICHACDAERHRLGEDCRGRHRRSPLELAARRALFNLGERFVEEYELEGFHFDFAVPRLGLLFEIDGRTYHHSPARRNRDQRKTRLAEQQGWTVKRVAGDAVEVEDLVRALVEARLESRMGLDEP